MATTIRVVLADDHAVVRAGLRVLLADEPGLILVGEATTGDEAQRLCAARQPDVLLLDLSMPGPPAAATVAFLGVHAPQTRVVVLTAHHDKAAVRALVALGIAGYILKDDDAEAVAGAIRSAASGGLWLSATVRAGLVLPAPPTSAAEPTLTPRERELLALIAQGWDNARLAAELHLGEQTVRNYVSRLYTKLGLLTRAEAVVWAREHDLLGDD